MTSLGSGLENVISTNNEIPTVMDAITKREIYLPIIGFAALVITTFFFKSKLNKN